MTGAYSVSSTTDSDVVAAAAFAVKAEKRLMLKKGSHSVRLSLIEIFGAQRQVVAGLNYRLELKLKLNGVQKEAVPLCTETYPARIN